MMRVIKGSAHVDDVFEVLDCALRSRYLAPEALSALPIWERLPTYIQYPGLPGELVPVFNWRYLYTIYEIGRASCRERV